MSDQSMHGNVDDQTPLAAFVAPTTTEDDTVVSISISHGSLENADHPVMVATFAGEYLSGAERFLDQQLDGQLSSAWEVGRYPAEPGTSLFIPPSRDAATSTQPPGAYIVGLGSTMRLGRKEVTFAVQQALLDRGLQLHRAAEALEADPSTTFAVGVSSILLGVRNDDGMRVGDSVAAIVEGVRAANSLIARYERSRPVPVPKVRYTALEFIERYADRADLAAVALRSLRGAVMLGEGYEALAHAAVVAKKGGLPAGASLFESPARWRRILLTGVPSDRQGESPSRRLELDVAVFSGDARADRVHHHLDRVLVERLVDHVGADAGDSSAAGALYDQLVPHDLRSQFLTTASVHLIVDKVTANFPWELLTAPKPDGTSAPIAAVGSVLRQFAESEERRVDPVRAPVGRALVVAAGKVPGHDPLEKVHGEARAVSQFLRSIGKVEVLSDEQGPIDLVALQKALFDGPQILHIASHGEYVPDRPDDTGAVLTEDAMLTVDTVRQLTRAPDVVFLNCCSLGKVGMSRLASGLAREFMAIGTGAVIAAGWPINDGGAARFASAFYREMIAGHSFGDAVTKARSECSKDGGTSWAAYQCYGDPAFVLRNRAHNLDRDVSDPVSLTDLVARLQALDIRASDLGRPGKGGVLDRRVQLVQEWEELQKWADGREDIKSSPAVQRLLGSTALALGELRRAAERHLTQVAVDEGTGAVRLAGPAASPVDLQQAANCLARAAQQEARAAKAAGDATRLAAAMADFDRAGRIGLAAVDLLPDRESHGVLASALKRYATICDGATRSAVLLGALQAYQQAQRVRSRDPWGAQNALQLGLILGGEQAAQARKALAAAARAARRAERVAAGRAAAPADDTVASAPATPAVVQVDRRLVPPMDFWGSADAGDRRLTALVASSSRADRATIAAEMVAAYREAFEGRSTHAQRGSVLDHLRDLADLLPEGDGRVAVIRAALAELLQWQEERVEATAVVPVPPAPALRDDDARGRRANAAVTLTAFPAACGDCLLLEYPGDDGVVHRMLVDGGLDSAYEGGLGRHLTAQQVPFAVDVAVVTHVDNDHILGIIEAVREKHLAPADLWFNGLPEITSGTRGTRQGDELSDLLPRQLRNRAIGGKAFMVSPPDERLPVVPLAGGATVTVLSPTLERLERLRKKWVDRKRGGNTLADLLERMEDEPVRGRVKAFGKDPSVANGSSIAFLFERGDARLLLTGDAFAAELTTAIRRLLAERGQEILDVDLLKLSHHGSRNNVTADLLRLVRPRQILVCTDGTKFEHPDEDALQLVRDHHPTVPFVFTDANDHIRARAAVVGGAPPETVPVVLHF